MLNDRLAIAYDEQKDRGLYYLGGLERRKNERKALVADVSLEELKAHYLMGQRGQRYWGVKRPITFTHTYEDEDGNEIGRKYS